MSYKDVDGEDTSRKQKMPLRSSWMGGGRRNPRTNCIWYISINTYYLKNMELVENQPGVEERNVTIFQRILKMCVSRKYTSPKAV